RGSGGGEVLAGGGGWEGNGAPVFRGRLGGRADRQRGDVSGGGGAADEAADRLRDRRHDLGGGRATAGGAQDGFQTRFREEFSLLIACLGDAVGKDVNAFAGRQRRSAGGVDRIGANAEDDAFGALDHLER